MAFVSASAEGASLGLFNYDSLKSPKKQRLKANLNLYKGDADLTKLWDDGLVLADSQNFARTLMETPANLMNPTIFTDTISERLSQASNVEVYARYVYSSFTNIPLITMPNPI